MCASVDVVSGLSDEKRLIKYLLDNYENVGVIGRPVLNTSATITVYFGLALIQILDLDEKNQILNTNVWSRYVNCSIAVIRLLVLLLLLCHSYYYCLRDPALELASYKRQLNTLLYIG